MPGGALESLGQQLKRLLLAQFLSLIDDETTRETCRAASGSRFTEALIALFMVVGLNPSKQLGIALIETHLSYQNLRQLAQLLPKRKAAVLHATTWQRMCFEALCVLDKGANKKRDADLAHALRKIREEALGEFTRSPENGEAIYDRITEKVLAQVATHATQSAPRNAELGSSGDGRGGAHHAQSFMDWAHAYALLKKYCSRKVFGGKCGAANFAFDYSNEGEAELCKNLGEEGFKVRKQQFLERQAQLKAKREAATKAVNNHGAKANGGTDKSNKFNLSAPARARRGFGFHAQSQPLEGGAGNDARASVRSVDLLDLGSALIDIITGVSDDVTAATNAVQHACASMYTRLTGCSGARSLDIDADGVPMVAAPPLVCHCGIPRPPLEYKPSVFELPKATRCAMPILQVRTQHPSIRRTQLSRPAWTRRGGAGRRLFAVQRRRG